MTERDVHALRTAALARLAEATRAANGAPDVESTLGHLTAARSKTTTTRNSGVRSWLCRRRRWRICGTSPSTLDWKQSSLADHTPPRPPEPSALLVTQEWMPPIKAWPGEGGAKTSRCALPPARYALLPVHRHRLRERCSTGRGVRRGLWGRESPGSSGTGSPTLAYLGIVAK